MKYMMMLFSEEPVVEVTPETVASWAGFRREAGKLAWCVSGDALQAPATARVVSVRNGGTLVTDGPFSDTKEQLAGYNIFDCEDLDAAIKVASMLPWATKGHVEIRPVVEFGGQG